jgi:hypothetical protein
MIPLHGQNTKVLQAIKFNFMNFYEDYSPIQESNIKIQCRNKVKLVKKWNKIVCLPYDMCLSAMF